MAWLSGWGRRQKLHIDSSSDGALTNYQKKITINYGSGTSSGVNMYAGSNCETDFDDIRFTTDDGQTLLDHYRVQKTDSDKAVFYVEIDSIPSSGGVDIYVYYDNNAVSSISNGSSTFDHFEDFEGTNVFDHAGFTGITTQENTSTYKEGSKSLENITDSQTHKVQLQNDYDFDPDDYYIEGWCRGESGGGTNENLGPGLTICGSAAANTGYMVILDNRSAVSPQIRKDTDYSGRTDGSYQTSLDTWYLLSIYRIDSSGDLKAEIWTEAAVYGTSPTSTTTRSAEDSHSTGKHGLYTYNTNHSLWDAIWVRKRADDEPAYGSWTAEETEPTTTIDFSPFPCHLDLS